VKVYPLPSQSPPSEKQASTLAKLRLFCPENYTFNGLNVSVFCGYLLKKEALQEENVELMCILIF